MSMSSDSWDERYSASSAVWSTTPNMWVEQVSAGLPAGTALDLAAGEGRNAIWLVEHGWRATAVDFSAVALERARSCAVDRLGPAADQLTTVTADLLDYEPEATYDLVLVVYLQLAAEQRRDVLRRAASAVADEGTLLVVAHDSHNLSGGYGGPQDPALLYTADDVAADLADTGLSAVRLEQVRRRVETAEGPRDALDALAVLHRSASLPHH
jgi:SAM-dependent methyltransferase